MAPARGPRLVNGRKKLIEASVTNFTQLGYHGTSVRDIARDADVTVASIYHYFPSKQEILVEIMTRTMSEVIGLTRSALLDAGKEPGHQLGALVYAWILFHTRHQREALIGASELRSLEESGRRLVVALRDEQEALFRDVIGRGVEAGSFRTGYPREAARAVINMGYSVASWYQQGGALTPEQLAAAYVELAMGTVGANPDGNEEVG